MNSVSTESMIGALFMVLMALIGWNGSRAHGRLDKLEDEMNALLRRMPNDFVGKQDFKSSEERTEKRVEKIETAIITGFSEFSHKLDQCVDKIFQKLDTKQDK